MAIIISVRNFLVNPADTWKKKLAWVIIGSVIGFFLNLLLNAGKDFLVEKFGEKPYILSNVVISKYANITGFTHMKNFYFLYFLDENWATLYFLNASDKEKINRYGNVITGIFFDFNNCPECSYYSFTLKNIGSKKADKIVIDIRSSVTPEIILDSPKMIKKDCGGYFESKGCYIIFENIEKEEEINFVLLTRESSDLFILSCMVDEKYQCEFRFIRVSAQNIDPKRDILIMDDKKVLFPTLENSRPNTLFYFDPSKFNESQTTWVTIPTVIERGK